MYRQIQQANDTVTVCQYSGEIGYVSFVGVGNWNEGTERVYEIGTCSSRSKIFNTNGPNGLRGRFSTRVFEEEA